MFDLASMVPLQLSTKAFLFAGVLHLQIKKINGIVGEEHQQWRKYLLQEENEVFFRVILVFVAKNSLPLQVFFTCK